MRLFGNTYNSLSLSRTGGREGSTQETKFLRFLRSWKTSLLRHKNMSKYDLVRYYYFLFNFRDKECTIRYGTFLFEISLNYDRNMLYSEN